MERDSPNFRSTLSLESRETGNKSSEINLVVKPATEDRNLRRTFLEHATTVAHACLVFAGLYLVYFCFKDEWRLFIWHPMLYTFGWVIILSEGALFLTRENVFSLQASPATRHRIHWIMQLSGTVLATVAFAIIVKLKNDFDKPHFTTVHGIAGFVATIFGYVSCVNGVLALYALELKHLVHPTISRHLHSATSILALFFAAVSMISALYTHWFTRVSEGAIDAFVILFVALLLGFAWTLFRPSVNFCRRMKVLLGR